MAITDRTSIKPGVKLVARYKSEVYHADVVEAGIPDKEGTELRFRVGNHEFTSPSGAGSFVRGGKATNGWAFWTVDTEPAKPAKPAKAASAPKPRQRKTPESPQDSNQGLASAPEGDVVSAEEAVPCAECGETFPSVAAATEHYYATHGKPEGEPTA